MRARQPEELSLYRMLKLQQSLLRKRSLVGRKGWCRLFSCRRAGNANGLLMCICVFRTSKTANKLKVLPATATPVELLDDDEEDEDSDDEQGGDEVERVKRSAKPAKANGKTGPEGVEVSPCC